jgi:hypothetical protein
MEHNGLYARLYSMQFRDSDEGLAPPYLEGKDDDNEKAPSEKPAGLLDMILKRT